MQLVFFQGEARLLCAINFSYDFDTFDECINSKLFEKKRQYKFFFLWILTSVVVLSTRPGSVSNFLDDMFCIQFLFNLQ